MRQEEIILYLSDLGLKKRQSRTYLTLLKLGKTSASRVAKESNTERTTIYKILEELVEAGLASKNIKGKRIEYEALSPRVLGEILNKKKLSLEKVITPLLSMRNKKSVEPTIRFYTTKNQIKKLIMESLESKEKICRDFASVELVVSLFGVTFVEHYIEQRIKKEVKVLSLRNEPSGKSLEKEPWYLEPNNKDVLREVRYLNKDSEFDSFIKIYDDVIIMISSDGSPFAAKIQNTKLSKAMKILFDISWGSAKKI